MQSKAEGPGRAGKYTQSSRVTTSLCVTSLANCTDFRVVRDNSISARGGEIGYELVFQVSSRGMEIGYELVFQVSSRGGDWIQACWTCHCPWTEWCSTRGQGRDAMPSIVRQRVACRVSASSARRTVRAVKRDCRALKKSCRKLFVTAVERSRLCVQL